MQAHIRNRTMECVIVVGVVVGCVLIIFQLLIQAVQRVHWVGFKDIEIEFVVSNIDNRQLIEDAIIHIRAEEGGFCAEREKHDFTLRTDENGSAIRISKQCMCFGTSGWNIDTFAMHLPRWYYRVSARGYHGSELTEVETHENSRNVRRAEPAAKLTIAVALKKERAAPVAAP